MLVGFFLWWGEMFPLKDFIWKEASFELNSLIKPPDRLDETLLTDEYNLNLEDNT